MMKKISAKGGPASGWNKTIALLTSSITLLVAVFIFICPISQNYFMRGQNEMQTDCADNFTNDCLAIHAKNVGLFLNIQNKITEATSFIFSFATPASLIFIAFIAPILLFAMLSRFRHRFLFTPLSIFSLKL